MIAPRHILGTFDEALAALRSNVLMMAGLSERSLERAIKGLFDRNDDLCANTIADDEEIDQLEKQIAQKKNSRDLFVVHGRNEACRETVARFLEKLNLKPIILHEQPNKGRTIIEKFVDYSDVSFAVILLTADDRGGLASDSFDAQRP